jgi:fructokinase
MFVLIGQALADPVGQPDPARASRGSPADVALGLGRRGDPVTLMTRLGRDASAT